jgi:DNA-binding CsgD family transcriptional regulator
MAHLDIFLLTSAIILGTISSVYTFQLYKIYRHYFLLNLVRYIIFFNLFIFSQLFFVYAYVNILNDYPSFVVQRILLIHKIFDFLTQFGIAYYFFSILFDFLGKEVSPCFKKNIRAIMVLLILGYLLGIVTYFASSTSTIFMLTKMISEYIFIVFILSILVYFLIHTINIKDLSKRKAVNLFGYFYLTSFAVDVLALLFFNNKELFITILSLLINIFPIIWLKFVYLKYYIFPDSALKDINPVSLLSERYGITNREMEILQLLINGKSNKEIEDLLFISINTVKNHVSCLFKKLGINSRGQLMNLVLTLGNNQDDDLPN